MSEFKTINKNVKEELTEKKSKFICDIFYVESEEEIEGILKKVKKEYFDAKHHCFAYRILDGENVIQRSSDDGEPSRNSWKTNAYHTGKK